MAETETVNETARGRRAKPPFRADHVGSLLRPTELLRAREQFQAGAITAGELRAIEDEAIRAIVKMQHDVGLQSATDGEFRRASWHMDFIYRLGGIEKAPGDITVHFRNDEGEIDFTPAAIHVADKVHLEETIFGEDFEFLQSTIEDGTTAKLTIPSPSMVHYRGGRAAIDPDVYSDVEEFWADLTSAYADQCKAVAELGCTYLQFDDTSLAYLNDPRQREQMASSGEDAEHLHETYIRHLNEVLDTRPAGLNVTTHMCRGNFRSSWVAEGGYDFVAEALFGGSTSTASSSSTTTRAPAASSRCASCRPARWWCSGWSRPSAASSRARTSSSGGSRRHPSSSPWSSSASRPSAGSRRPARATR